MSKTKIKAAKEDINFYNGFRTAIMLFNRSFQHLNVLYDQDVEDYQKFSKKIQDGIELIYMDLNRFEGAMYGDMKKMYGMNLKVDKDGNYFIEMENEIH